MARIKIECSQEDKNYIMSYIKCCFSVEECDRYESCDECVAENIEFVIKGE